MEWKNDIAIYLQVIELIKRDVIVEKYKSGNKIPSVRELSQTLSINPNTIVKVYDILTNEGLIEAKSTNGYFLTDNEEIINNLKPEFAKKYTKNYLEQMEKIGYSADEIICYIKEEI